MLSPSFRGTCAEGELAAGAGMSCCICEGQKKGRFHLNRGAAKKEERSPKQ